MNTIEQTTFDDLKVLMTELGFEHLPTLSEFVKGTNSALSVDFCNRVIRYTDFITQPLTKGMFILCDEEGNALSKPHFNDLRYKEKWSKRQQAKERVIFDGWVTYSQAQSSILIKDKDGFYLNFSYDGVVRTAFSGDVYTTIESIITDGCKLILKI